MAAVQDETGDAADGEERKQVAGREGYRGNLGLKLDAMILHPTSRAPVGSQTIFAPASP